MAESSRKPPTITPSQTVGPFFSFCLTPVDREGVGSVGLAQPNAAGQRIAIKGYVLDGQRAPVPDALIEVWQADGQGHYARGTSSFTGFARFACDDQGRFTIDTVKPGSVIDVDGRRHAPHIAAGVFGKGINRRLYTRIYFADERSNDDDPVLLSVPAERRATMIARRSDADVARYDFAIRLQGADETVFLDP
ncbi:MAG TPA: protocatechuate 3,4-dioxygenase subunit alpha [Casimicrobiaceae bacterium]|nr:protocatechuate 3,4-dioxygenase subunit alpha [Casimicrobiaceae bacterium]